MAGDTYFDSVSVLLHFDGSNGSTTFTDSSSSPHTFSALNSATLAIATPDPKFGTASLKLTPVNSCIYTPIDSSLQLGTGDFTIEGWYYLPSGLTSYHALFTVAPVGATGGYMELYWFPNNSVCTLDICGSQYPVPLYTYLTVNTWHHVAVARSSGVVKVFIDGTTRLTQANSASISPQVGGSNRLVIGGRYGSLGLEGYIDDFRFTKGVARYTADFSPPTEAFADYQSSVVDPVLAVPYWIRHRTDSSLITDVAPDGSGGVWAARVLYGETGDGVSFSTSNYMLFLDRYDAQGTVLRTAKLETFTPHDTAVVNTPINITTDVFHGVVMNVSSGVFVGYAASQYMITGYKYAVTKADTAGVPIWKVGLTDNTAASLQAAHKIELNAAGSHVYSEMAFPVISSGVITGYSTQIAKLAAANGTISWQRKITPNTPTYDALIPAGIAAIADGNVYVAVTAQLSGTDKVGIVYKYNSSGTLQWQKIITIGTDGKCLGLAIDASENVYAAVAVPSTSTLHVVGIATSGTLTWQRNIVFTGQLVEAIGGITWDSTNSKIYATVTVDFDHYISRLTSAGVVDWTRKIYRTTGGRDTAGRVKVDPTSGVFLVAGSSV